MHESQSFLHALAVVLCVAAVTTVLFQRLRQPVVLGYVIAGLVVGPHVPVPLVADPEIVHTLSELGVILLMFSLGLEFSLRKIIDLGPRVSLIAIVQSSFVFWLGTLLGRAFGWTPLEGLFTGAILAISSTTIIAKVFDEQDIRGPLRDLVVGVLVVEDLIAILLMATFTAVASGAGLSLGPLAVVVGRLAAFLVVLVGLGLLVVPRAIRMIRRLGRPETTLVASVGLCFAVALLAKTFGYSTALGAFIAGSLVAESGEEGAIAHLVEPVRDMFAAIFFVSVGMLIDPKLVIQHAGAVAALVAVVLVGKPLGVAVSAFLTGNGMRTSIRAGMSMAQIGEFSFILAGLGLSLGATREFLYPVAVAVSAVTTLTTPAMVRVSGGFASWTDRALPHPLQMVAALYGSWIERLRLAREGRARVSGARRLAALLVLDATLLALLAIAASRELIPFSAFVQQRFGFSPALAGAALVGVTLLIAVPLVIGVLRLARSLGQSLADSALPPTPRERVDLADAPRRTFVVTLQLAVLGLVAAPLLAITQPFVSGAPGVILIVIIAVAIGVAFWKNATNLEGHVRAGSELIVQALSSQTRTKDAADVERTVDRVETFLPGLGDLQAVEVTAECAASEQTLADLNLRGVTGATVLAVRHADGTTKAPDANEVLRAGDVLVLTGTHDAVAAAKELLEKRPC
jgi:CPA2 family monovalent cation:H+ antiporter-2